MDLWVRSISKRILLKIDNILVVEAENKHCLYTLSHDEEIELGEYETKERALEVLDEIQKLLIGDFIKFVNIDVDKDIVDYLNSKAILINDPDCKQKVSFEHRDCIVFEMPEK